MDQLITQKLKHAHLAAVPAPEAPIVKKERQGVDHLQRLLERSRHQIMNEHFHPSSYNPTPLFLPRLAFFAIRPDWIMRR